MSGQTSVKSDSVQLRALAGLVRDYFDCERTGRVRRKRSGWRDAPQDLPTLRFRLESLADEVLDHAPQLLEGSPR